MTLTAEELGLRYPTQRDRPALRALTLRLDPGERLAVVGPNGSGKSTLLRLLAGLLTPTTGCASLDGRPVHTLPAAHRAARIAYVPQSPSLAFAFDVARFVAFGRHALGRRGLADHVRGALEAVDLADRADEPLGVLSQGQRQRASIARALCQIADPPAGGALLLADEPTASLDPRHTAEIMRVFHGLRGRGITVIAALHDLAAAAEFDRVLLLGPDGAALADGPPEQALAPEPLRAAFGIDFERLLGRDGRLRALTPLG